MTRPTATSVTHKVQYTQKGHITYHASAPTGPVYPNGTVSTGDPIFLQLVHPHEVFVIGDAVDEVNGVLAAFRSDLAQHGRERRKSGAAGQEQGWPFQFTQVEGTERAVELDPVTHLG